MNLPFLNSPQRKLKQLQREVNALALSRQIEQEESRLAALKDKQTFAPITRRVQESLTTSLFGNPNLRALSGYVSLVEVPAMIREQFPYKQALIRTIVQLDFVRWIGRILYEDCPTFATAINAMGAMIYGCEGLIAKAYSLEPEENEELVDEVNELICEADEANDFLSWQKEIHCRYHKDGEAFVRVEMRRSTTEESEAYPIIACIEPDYIRPSVQRGQSQEDPHVTAAMGPGMNGGEDWSFGIFNDPYRWYEPKKYMVVWPPEWRREEVVDAEDMFHIAHREHRNMKRGVPTCFKVVDDIVRVTLHREADGDSAVLRAKITGVVEYDTNVDQSYVQTDLAQLAKHASEGSVSSDITASPYYVYPLEPGVQSNFIGLLRGRRFVAPPAMDATASKEIYERGIKTIAAYYALPGFVFGIDSDASFASSLVEESMPARIRENEQGMFCRHWCKVIRRICELKHPLGKALWEKIGINVAGPSMVVRDIKTETEAHIARVQAKLESPQTAQAELGLDSEEELTNIEIAANIPELQPEQTLDANGEPVEGSPNAEQKRSQQADEESSKE